MKISYSEKQLREFGLLIAFGFPIFIGWILPAITGHVFRTWTLLLAIPCFLLGIFKPSLLSYPYKLWMKFGNILAWLNSRIILGLVFLIVLQPIAFIMKILGYDPLRTKKSNEKSYRENKQKYSINLNKIF
tara:strand:+ start:641 stop:1033 length:393 start_codon:yes stop_codon:yes gene_type:complete